jgi:hypothetical protein
VVGRVQVSRERARLPQAIAGVTATGAALAALACGSSNPRARASASEANAEQRSEVQFEDYARCLREHGVEAEAGSHGIKVNGPSEVMMKAAEKACARYRPPEQRGADRMSAQERVQIEEKLQRFARCMRGHGVQIEVAAPGGRPQINIHATAGAPNPESPAFRAAQKACRQLLPGGGPGGGASSPAGGG